jgi:nucleoside-diphosphate-sugar epimerase
MKIMVAGGAGYIGSALIPKLLERGYEVEVVDLLWFGCHLSKGVKVIKKNILDLDKEDLANIDQVIFLAGLSNDPMAEFSPSLNFIYNASAAAYLAYLSKSAKVKRYIYAGSCSSYGYTVNELYDEESPAVSDYPYGISKLQGEQAAMQLCDENFSVICFRQGTISGYSPRMRLDLVVNTMVKSAISQREVVVNNPSIWRPILSIEDAVSAYIRATEASAEISSVFNIASGNYTVGEIADVVKEIVESQLNLKVRLKIKYLKDFRNYKVSFEKAMNVLSFKPRHNLESIVLNLVENLTKFEDFSNPQYYNIEVLKSICSNGRNLL